MNDDMDQVGEKIFRWPVALGLAILWPFAWIANLFKAKP